MLVTALCVAAPQTVHALRHREDGDGDGDRIGIFQTMRISDEHPADDVVCAFCTVQVDGDVHGDIAVVFSTVNVAAGRTVSGDVAMMFSTLVAGEGVRINGDMANLFSTVSLAESTHVRGEKAIVSTGLGLGVMFAPLLIAVGVVWLLVWVVRRMSY